MKPNVVTMNPLSDAEQELDAYFKNTLGVHAQNMSNGGGGGGWDDAAVSRLHMARLQPAHARAIESARLVEMTLARVDSRTRYALALGFERRGYSYKTPFGASYLWQAFRRVGSNVGLLGLVLEVPDVADQYVTTRARSKDGYDCETEDEPTVGKLLGFLEDTAVDAFNRWNDKRTAMEPEQKNADDTRWMRWLPKWFPRVAHAADRRLVGALRTYEDVRQTRLDWECGPLLDEKRRKKTAQKHAQIDRIIRLAQGLS